MYLLVLIFGIILFTVYPMVHEGYLNHCQRNNKVSHLPSFHTVRIVYLIFAIIMAIIYFLK